MAAPLGEHTAVLAAEERSLHSVPMPNRPTALSKLSYQLFVAHLLALGELALSNVFLGLSVLAAPFSGRLRDLGRREQRPLLLVAAVYVALLGVSVLASFDPAHSAHSLSELFALCTLLLGLMLFSGEERVGLLLLLLLPAAVTERVASIVDPEDATNSDRLYMAKAGLEMIAERPLLGQGPDMVEVRYPLYRFPAATRKFVPHLHDAFLE